jgi:peptide/nickel transport system substrate-binding protein
LVRQLDQDAPAMFHALPPAPLATCHWLPRCCWALLLAGIALQASPATAQTLPIGVANPVSSADPHISNTTSNFAMTGHVFEPLVTRDAQLRLRPRLAESWRAVSDTAWEFRLRPGVLWHDGQLLRADDVAFTIGRVPNVPGSNGRFSGAVKPLTRVEVVDDRTLWFHTAQPHPLLPNDLANVQIISRHAGDGAAPEDYNSGKASIGAGRIGSPPTARGRAPPSRATMPIGVAGPNGLRWITAFWPTMARAAPPSCPATWT